MEVRRRGGTPSVPSDIAPVSRRKEMGHSDTVMTASLSEMIVVGPRESRPFSHPWTGLRD